MGVDNDSRNIVKRNAANFIATFFDDQEASKYSQMLAIGGNINDAIHCPHPRLLRGSWNTVNFTLK